MSSKITNDLVRKAQKGDADSFGELYSIFKDDMFRFAYYYTGSVSLAEDAVSEAALIAFQKIPQLKKASAFKSWLFKILYNECKAAQKEKALAAKSSELSEHQSLTYYSGDTNERDIHQRATEHLLFLLPYFPSPQRGILLDEN